MSTCSHSAYFVIASPDQHIIFTCSVNVDPSDYMSNEFIIMSNSGMINTLTSKMTSLFLNRTIKFEDRNMFVYLTQSGFRLILVIYNGQFIRCEMTQQALNSIADLFVEQLFNPLYRAGEQITDPGFTKAVTNILLKL